MRYLRPEPPLLEQSQYYQTKWRSEIPPYIEAGLKFDAELIMPVNEAKMRVRWMLGPVSTLEASDIRTQKFRS